MNVCCRFIQRIQNNQHTEVPSMKFTKMHGLGNDFVVVVGRDHVPVNVTKLAIQVCDRHKGIGADGLVYILPSQTGDFQMRIFNPDGSEADQCGNALRCVSKYYFERISSAKTELLVQTKHLLQKVSLKTKDGKVVHVRVDMGEPILQADLIPVISKRKFAKKETIQIDGHSFTFTGVSMGNPHAVIEVEDVNQIPLEIWGPQIENHKRFPKRTNVEFVTHHSTSEVTMRVWERGAGLTMACGSGACATVVAGVWNGRLDRVVTVHLTGGDLLIEWDEAENRVYMTGPATYVFEGVWY